MPFPRHNAGHTIYKEEEKFVLHLIPSGIFYDHVSCFIGQGVILSIDSLLEEIEQLEQKGYKPRGQVKDKSILQFIVASTR